MSRLIDADALMGASMYEFWQDASAITPTGEYILKKFRQLIRNMPTVTPEPQWIPCSERLPEKSSYNLVTDFGGVEEAYYKCNEHRWYGRHDDELKDVTAWMPLPSPYREEGEQE